MGPTSIQDPKLKKRMQALMQLEGGLDELDYDVDTPAGQLHVSRAPLVPKIDLENLEVSGPVSGLGRPSAGGMKPEELSAPARPPLPVADADMDAAKALDEEAMRQRLFETATRQLIGGLTRTAPQATLTQESTKQKDLLTQRHQARMNALRELEAGNNAKRTDAYLGAQDKQSALAEKRLALDESEAKARGERAAAAQLFDREKFDEDKRHHRATEGIGWTSAKRADAKAERDDERLKLKTDAIKPRAGWEPIEADAPTFRDAAQAKKFDDSVAAMGAIRNHRDHVLHGLEELKAAKNPRDVDIALAKINAQMGALASKLRDAEGLNNTDASNHAVDTMLSLANGSIVNLKNLANEGRLPAILEAAVGSGEANLETMARSNNLRRAKGGSAGPAAAPQRPTATNPKTGQKVEWDGKEWVSVK